MAFGAFYGMRTLFNGQAHDRLTAFTGTVALGADILYTSVIGGEKRLERTCDFHIQFVLAASCGMVFRHYSKDHYHKRYPHNRCQNTRAHQKIYYK